MPKNNETNSNGKHDNMPFLEYQVLVNRPIADSKSLIIGEADVDGKKVMRKITRNRPIPFGAFVLEN